jgi:hypothetical protein
MKGSPLRTCVGCRQVRAKAALMRLVRRDGGVVQVDFSGSAAGRGAYVCPASACVEKALRPGRLAHAFRARAQVSPELLAWVESLSGVEVAGRKGR